MSRGAWRGAARYWLTCYRRTWRGTVFTSFVGPVLFLAAMGKGLGSLVDANDALRGRFGISYVSFLAPGLLASSTLMSTAQEATYPVNGAVRWNRSYIAMVNTPLRPVDALWGTLSFITMRALSVAAMFVVVMFLFDAVESPWVLAAIPTAALGGLAVAVPLCAYSIQLENDGGFAALNRFLLTPMMLFAGAFFPVSQLPAAIRPVAYVTPMWHSVDLARSLALGDASIGRTLMHVAVLAGFVALGVELSRRTYRRVLTP